MSVIQRIASIHERFSENSRWLHSDYGRELEAVIVQAIVDEVGGQENPSRFFAGEFSNLRPAEMIRPVWQLLARLAEHTSSTPPTASVRRGTVSFILGDVQSAERRYMQSHNTVGYRDARILAEVEAMLQRRGDFLHKQGKNMDELLLLSKHADRLCREVLLLGVSQRILNRA